MVYNSRIENLINCLYAVVIGAVILTVLTQPEIDAAEIETWQPTDCDRETYMRYNGCNKTVWRNHRRTCNKIRHLLQRHHSGSSLQNTLEDIEEPSEQTSVDHGCIEDEMLLEEQAVHYLKDLQTFPPSPSKPLGDQSGPKAIHKDVQNLQQNPSGYLVGSQSSKAFPSEARPNRDQAKPSEQKGRRQRRAAPRRLRRRAQVKAAHARRGLNSPERRSARVRRYLTANSTNNRWRNRTVGFKIDGAAGSDNAKVILEAVAMWQNTTCLNFHQYDTNEPVKENHILFLYALSPVCSSYIGMVDGLVPQPVYLGFLCYTTGVIAHEIGHALGLIHEHQRFDRDDFVTILSANILQPDMFYRFDSAYLDNWRRAYDYASDLHYRSTAYSSNGENTIETKDPQYQTTIGQRQELSFYDIYDINRAYCSDVCSNVTLAQPCSNGGYQDPKNCSTCRCPDGWAGSFCESVKSPVNGDCGGWLRADSILRRTYTPGYGSPGGEGRYENNQECSWLIESLNGEKVVMEFEEDFGVFCYSEEDSCPHWVEVRYRSDLGAAGPRFCCYKRPNREFISEGTKILIVFKSYDTVAHAAERRGFAFTFRAVDPDNTTYNDTPAEHFTVTPQQTSNASSSTSDAVSHDRGLGGDHGIGKSLSTDKSFASTSLSKPFSFFSVSSRALSSSSASSLPSITTITVQTNTLTSHFATTHFLNNNDASSTSYTGSDEVAGTKSHTPSTTSTSASTISTVITNASTISTNSRPTSTTSTSKIITSTTSASTTSASTTSTSTISTSTISTSTTVSSTTITSTTSTSTISTSKTSTITVSTSTISTTTTATATTVNTGSISTSTTSGQRSSEHSTYSTISRKSGAANTLEERHTSLSPVPARTSIASSVTTSPSSTVYSSLLNQLSISISSSSSYSEYISSSTKSLISSTQSTSSSIKSFSSFTKFGSSVSSQESTISTRSTPRDHFSTSSVPPGSTHRISNPENDGLSDVTNGIGGMKGCRNVTGNCTVNCGGCGNRTVARECWDSERNIITNSTSTESCVPITPIPACVRIDTFWVGRFYQDETPYCCDGYRLFRKICTRLSE